MSPATVPPVAFPVAAASPVAVAEPPSGAPAPPRRKHPSIFASISSREVALVMVKDASIAFLVIGVVEAVLGALFSPPLLLDALLFFLFGFLLLRLRSRVAAVLLLLLTLAALGATVGNALGAEISGGRNIFLSIFCLVVAVRAVEATFKLHSIFAIPAQQPPGHA